MPEEGLGFLAFGLSILMSLPQTNRTGRFAVKLQDPKQSQSPKPKDPRPAFVLFCLFTFGLIMMQRSTS
jgi:hypothetical protein